MAETRRAVVKSTRVYIPEPGVHIQTAHSDEYPGGRVIHLTHGWTDLDEELSSHPQLSRLSRPDDEALEAQHKLDLARAAEVQAAQDKFTFDSIKQQDEQLEVLRKTDLERAKGIDEALAKGERVEADPVMDPAARYAVTLTGSNDYLMVSAAGMAAKWDPTDWYTIPKPPAVAPPENVDVPHVTGDAIVGGMLACTNGNWNNMDTPTYMYQWKSNADDVGTGTSNYHILETDAGKTITCVVTAVNSLGAVAAPPSNGVVIPGPAGDATRTGGGTRRATA